MNKTRAIILFWLATTLMGCPKKTFYDWNEYIFLKSFQCFDKKYGMAYLINPKITKLPLSEKDTISIDGKLNKNVYIFEYNSLVEYKSGTKIAFGNENAFGSLQSCADVKYLPFIKQVSGISEIK